MRILFITNYYPPYEVGGYEQLCRDVVEQFRAHGHLIEVLTSNRGVNSGTVPVPGIHRVLRQQVDPASRLPIILQFFLVRRAAERHNRRCLARAVQSFHPEIVFIWNLQGLPLSIALAAEDLPGITVAYWLAGYTPAEPDDYWRYWQRAPKERLYLSRLKQLAANLAIAQMRREGGDIHPKMRHVAVVSRFMREKGLAEGTLPEHAMVIYNGVEIEQFFRPVAESVTGPFKLLFAGRVSPDKGVHTAIAAMAHLQQEEAFANVQLTIAGSGPAGYVDELQRQVARAHLTAQVSFCGWLPREKMPDLMKFHHGLLLPTEHPEPFARVVLEAMAAGLVVIGASTGGTGEIVRDGETGLTFPPGDSAALASQIKRLYLDSAFRRRLAQAGQTLVCEQFSLGRMVDNLEAFLQQAMEEDKLQ